MNLGLYCGSFNPFHLGHLNIYNKAKQIFTTVKICQGINSDKTNVQEMLFEVSGVDSNLIERYDGYTHKLIMKYEALGYNTTLIRGLRNSYDYDYEMNQIQFMRDFYPGLKVVLIPCDREFSHISSSAIRALEKLDWISANNYKYHNN